MMDKKLPIIEEVNEELDSEHWERLFEQLGSKRKKRINRLCFLVLLCITVVVWFALV